MKNYFQVQSGKKKSDINQGSLKSERPHLNTISNNCVLKMAIMQEVMLLTCATTANDFLNSVDKNKLTDVHIRIKNIR